MERVFNMSFGSNQVPIISLMPFQHSLACPHAGQWHLLFFRKKVNKKLSTAQFAMEGSAFISAPLPQIPRSKKRSTSVCAWARFNVNI